MGVILLKRLMQDTTPLFDAVKKYIDDKVVQFHVPGHKKGQGLQELREFIGDNAFCIDVNGMDDLDYLNNPIGVIDESQKLLAQAYGAEHAYFLVNGTTSGIQTMIMSVCEPGTEIIIPRNAHRSTIGGVILSGAIPAYIQPEINQELGIAMDITPESVKKAIKEHPHAKAIFVINPTYYGFVPDLKSIVRIAKSHSMAVIVDEAHGSHMSFHNDFPLTAMEVGADMSALSLHKTGGSFTQSSILLQRSNFISRDRVKQVLNLLTTSSASYLLMCSIDVARKQLATKGDALLENILKLSRYARDEINSISGFYAFGKELIGAPGCFEFDETKLGINVSSLGYTGYQIESILRKKYNIQIELSDLHNILAIVSLGHSLEDIDALINALKDISANSEIKDKKIINVSLENPKVIVSPRDAFYSAKKVVSLEQSEGEVSGEMIMAYPPGIPVICMGERISKNIIEHLKILKNEKCHLQGASDPNVDYIRVLGS